MPRSTNVPFGLYVRLSQEGPEGRGDVAPPTRRQESDCRKFAEERGYKVVEVYEDIDSAFRKGVRRDGFERMLEDMQAGTIKGVVAWKTDRFIRRPKDWLKFWEVCEPTGSVFLSVVEGLDSTTPAGRTFIQYAVLQAEMESENTSLRVKRAHEERASTGRVAGGKRAFGYNHDRTRIVPEEAKLIREAARRILDGRSVTSVVNDWNRRGVRTSQGNAWMTTTLKRMLVSPWVAGERVHRGEIVGPGQWKPILDKATAEKMRAHFRDPERRGNNGNRPGSAYVLTGVMVCGLCGQKMIGKPLSNQRRRYACHRLPGMARCGRVGIMAEAVEQLVTEMIFERMDDRLLKAIHRAKTGGEKHEGELLDGLKNDESALDRVTRDHYVEGIVSRRAFLQVKGELEKRIDSARRQLARKNGNGVLVEFNDVASIKKAWDSRDSEWRRAFVKTLVASVKVKPVGRGQRTVLPERVEVEWRDTVGEVIKKKTGVSRRR